MAPRDNSWLGVAVVALGVALIALAIVFLWMQMIPRAPASVEKYFPLANGASFIYRVRKPDGSVTYRARNIRRVRSNILVQALDLEMVDAFMQAANVDLLQIETTQAIRALTRIDAVVVSDVEYDKDGKPVKRTVAQAVVNPERIDLFASDNFEIQPPLPLLDLRAPAQTFTGTLDTNIPFTFSSARQPVAQISTALGDMRDCVRVEITLAFTSSTNHSRTTYCANIGEVLDETEIDAQGVERAELVALSIGDLVKGSAPFPGAGGVNAQPALVFSNTLGTNLTVTQQYREAATSDGITTQIVPAGDLLLFATARGALVALDRATAAGQWRFQTGNGIYSTPIVANGIVYFGSADKKVYAVRLDDGAFVWAFRTGDIVSAAPAVSDGAVYAASEDKKLYAIDADTGLARWTFPTGSPMIAAPVVSDSTVYISNSGGALYALDARTGAQKWSFAAEKGITAPVTPGDTLIFVAGNDGTVYALDRASGKALWQANLKTIVDAQPVVANGRVYVSASSEMFALDAANGAVVWRLRDMTHLFKGAPLLLGEQLWQLTSEDLTVIDANTGNILAHVPTTGASTNAGLSSDGRALFAGFFDGTVLGWEGAPR